jgi:hypothetical protein
MCVRISLPLPSCPEEQTDDSFFLIITFASGEWQTTKGMSIPLNGYYMQGRQVGFGKRCGAGREFRHHNVVLARGQASVSWPHTCSHGFHGRNSQQVSPPTLSGRRRIC